MLPALIAPLLLALAPPHELVDLPPGTLFPDGARIAAGATHTSIWIEPRRAFREALPSWNVDAPAGSGFIVELQASTAGTAPGPWLHIGDWVAPGSEGLTLPGKEERTTRMEEARVAIDILESERDLARIRVRVRAVGRGVVTVQRFAVVFSHMQHFKRPGLEAPAEAGPLRLVEASLRHGRPLEPRRQGAARAELASRICSPTSVAMIVAELGVPTPTEAVAARAYDPTHDIYGNWNRAVQAAWSLGVRGRLERFSTWDEVAGVLASGRRIVISLAAKEGALRGAPYPKTAGHLLVLWGLAEDGRVLVNDPAAATLEDVARVYLPQDLELTWMQRGGIAYVFERAR